MFTGFGANRDTHVVFHMKSLGDGIIVAGAQKTIIRSTDNGETFKPVFDVTKLDASITLVRYFVTAKNGTVYVALDASFSSPQPDMPDHNKHGQLWQSTDRGLTW